MGGSPHRVSDVMTRSVITVGRETPVKAVMERLAERQISAVPVVEEDGRVMGVVSEADLLPKRGLQDSSMDPGRGPQPSEQLKAGAATAGELMSAPALTVPPDATLAEAARIMARQEVKRLPVVTREGILQGVVSRSDLLKVFLRADNDLAEEIRCEITGVLFPEPIEPVRVTVSEGVARLTGQVPDATRIPLAVRLVRGVEGVVGVDCRLTAADPDEHNPRRPQ
ncbi:CBS domain-containing protein [Streptomyces sp. NPDC015139]|uniref:CBS domain-containing protein n=1 Tax=Streptomyces sp. NPDC015139 TaxID=3364942 RepID=UPI0036FA5ED9